MENSKLVSILRALSRDELKELEKFIASPYFTTGRDCMPLFLVLKARWPKFTGHSITKSAVYEELYPGKTYGDKKSKSILSTLSSELYGLTLEFLTYSNLKSDERGKKLLLLRNLLDKNLYKQFEAAYNDTITDNTLNENSERRGSAVNFLESFR